MGWSLTATWSRLTIYNWSICCYRNYLPKSNVKSRHVVGDVAVEVDEEVAGLAHDLRNLLNRIPVVANEAGKNGRQVRKDLKY